MSENNSTNNGSASNSDHDNHKKLYHWVYVAGWCLLSAVVDFAFLWPESHLLAFLALPALLSLPMIYEMTVAGVSPYWVGIAVIGLFAAFQNVYLIVGPNVIPEIEVVGILEPGEEPSPAAICGQPITDAVVALIGDSAIILRGPTKRTILRIGACEVLSITPSQGTISVESHLYNVKGKPIASIRNGSAHVLTGENVRQNRNGDLSTLVVTDGLGRELLYIHYSNPRTFRVRGIFACPNHVPVEVSENGITTGRTGKSLFAANCLINLGLTIP